MGLVVVLPIKPPTPRPLDFNHAVEAWVLRCTQDLRLPVFQVQCQATMPDPTASVSGNSHIAVVEILYNQGDSSQFTDFPTEFTYWEQQMATADMRLGYATKATTIMTANNIYGWTFHRPDAITPDTDNVNKDAHPLAQEERETEAEAKRRCRPSAFSLGTSPISSLKREVSLEEAQKKARNQMRRLSLQQGWREWPTCRADNFNPWDIVGIEIADGVIECYIRCKHCSSKFGEDGDVFKD